mgnify:CR=1 FL=1
MASVRQLEVCSLKFEAPEQMELPLHAWEEGLELKAQDGTKLERWGSAKQAMKILGIKDRATLYSMIQAGEIPARKLRQTSNGNSPYKIDLLACWEYNQARLGDACE